MTIKTYLEGSLLLDTFFGYDEESSSETQAMFTGYTLTEIQASCTAEVNIVPTVAKLSNSLETIVRTISMPVLGIQVCLVSYSIISIRTDNSRMRKIWASKVHQVL